MKQLFLSLRPKQWIKNAFIFIPLVFGKKLFYYPVNLKAVLAFLLFSLAAGVVYLINDIVDLEKDKLHPIKSKRPIASGEVGVKQAYLMIVVLGILTILLSFILNFYFGWIIIFYFIFNVLYTKLLKEAVILDVFSIAGFFFLRVLAGSVVSEIEMSHWLIFMVIFLSLFIGFSKRSQELRLLKKSAVAHRGVLARYELSFLTQMITIIAAAIVVTYMLYTVDHRTVMQFGTTNLIFSTPFVCYGIFRYLYLSNTVDETGDPTQILLSDWKMQLNLVFWVLVCVGVIYF